MHSTFAVFYVFSIIFFIGHIEAFFIFSAPPVVDESEIQEPPSYIRLRRDGLDRSENCYSWEIRQKCSNSQDGTTCVIEQCNRCAILRPGWIPQNRVCMMKTSCFCAAWAGSSRYQSCMNAFSKACA